MFIPNGLRALSIVCGPLRTTGLNLTSRVTLSSTVRFMSVSKEFEESKVRLGKLSDDPGNETKLKLYGLYKQSTEGVPTSKRPGMMDFVGRAKFDAWDVNKALSKEEAQNEYIKLVNSLLKEEESQAVSSAPGDFKNFIIENSNGLYKMTLNRPNKFNALTFDMYGEWVDALEQAASDPSVRVVAVTGAGSYYCSGNDLSNFTNVKPDEMKKMAADGKVVLKKFVGAFVDFPKPLVAVVNGPAVGISVTTMGLFDAVLASDKATFHTPFSSLGQSPEGCSTVTFPRMMGHGKAAELLYFNKKLTAEEAKERNLVTRVFPNDTFQQEAWKEVESWAKLPLGSLVHSKTLVRDVDRELLHKVNHNECERLGERWLSDDCINAIMAFFNRKK